MKATFNSAGRIRFAARGLFLALGVALALLALGCSTSAPAPSARAPSASASSKDAQHLVSILQYLESDYPAAVASNDGGELAEQRSLSQDALAAARALPTVAAFVPRLVAIDARVQRGDDGAGVGADCAALVEDLVATLGIVRAPSSPPDLEQGKQLFAVTCAGCHGATGAGDGPVAPSLHPRPANFHSSEVMDGLTPFKAFNVIRFGVKGTAMVPIDGLDEKQRWALAFYLFTLRQPECARAPASASLDELANGTDTALARAHGEGEVACLRRKPPGLDGQALLSTARAQVGEAMRLAGEGDPANAEKIVLDAYLTDIEPIEPWLRARDSEVVTQLEASFTLTRAHLQERDPRAAADAKELVALLDRAAGAHRATTKLSVFWFSLLVIVREGFEATVIIAALLAVLKKRKEASRARFVHAGWISALSVGAVVFFAGRKVLAGAMNEKLEGCLALVAVAMLLHAALWVNSRGVTRRSMGALRDRTRGALDRGALALFGIAFLAMFRESFETAVFLEALSIDAPAAVVWGAGVGVIVLCGIVLAMGRAGVRLPMQKLFDVSTVILVATAVVLLGQGIHSFEEVGLLPSRPMPFFRVEFLGIYPDRLSVLAQGALAALPFAWRWATARGAEKGALKEHAPDPGE